jgi:hypothetical protein
MPDKLLFNYELKINSLHYLIPQFGIRADNICGNLGNFFPTLFKQED